MKSQRKPMYAALIVVLVAALACNLPDSGSAPNLDEAYTLIAQTAQAATLTAGIPTATVTPGPSPTPPSIAPIVTVSSDTNCRTGPNIGYTFVMLFTTGMNAEVVQKHTPSGYWVIKYPGGNGATCWLWGQYASVTGETAGLPEGVPPPLPPTATPPPAAPNPPNQVHISCTSVNNSHKVGDFWILSWEWTVELEWNDDSDNEEGFSVYKDGTLLGTVGPGQESYTDVFSTGIFIAPAPTYVYGVQSFNDFGASVIKEREISECP